MINYIENSFATVNILNIIIPYLILGFGFIVVFVCKSLMQDSERRNTNYYVLSQILQELKYEKFNKKSLRKNSIYIKKENLDKYFQLVEREDALSMIKFIETEKNNNSDLDKGSVFFNAFFRGRLIFLVNALFTVLYTGFIILLFVLYGSYIKEAFDQNFFTGISSIAAFIFSMIYIYEVIYFLNNYNKFKTYIKVRKKYLLSLLSVTIIFAFAMFITNIILSSF